MNKEQKQQRAEIEIARLFLAQIELFDLFHLWLDARQRPKAFVRRAKKIIVNAEKGGRP